MTEHPVRILRREAIDAAQDMDYAKTQKEREYHKGVMYGLCKALDVIITPDAPAGYATDGYIPIGQTGLRTLRKFLGGHADHVLGKA